LGSESALNHQMRGSEELAVKDPLGLDEGLCRTIKVGSGGDLFSLGER
jgi:hypothetical protein